jgi:hypothetical protein
MHRRLGDQSHSRTVTCGCPPRSADLADSEGQLGIRRRGGLVTLVLEAVPLSIYASPLAESAHAKS